MTLNANLGTLNCPSRKTFLNFEAADDVSILDRLEKSLDDFQLLHQTSVGTEVLWDYFVEVVKQCINQFVPTHTKTTRKKALGSLEISFKEREE